MLFTAQHPCHRGRCGRGRWCSCSPTGCHRGLSSSCETPPPAGGARRPRGRCGPLACRQRQGHRGRADPHIAAAILRQRVDLVAARAASFITRAAGARRCRRAGRARPRRHRWCRSRCARWSPPAGCAPSRWRWIRAGLDMLEEIEAIGVAAPARTPPPLPTATHRSWLAVFGDLPDPVVGQGVRPSEWRRRGPASGCRPGCRRSASARLRCPATTKPCESRSVVHHGGLRQAVGGRQVSQHQRPRSIAVATRKLYIATSTGEPILPWLPRAGRPMLVIAATGCRNSVARGEPEWNLPSPVMRREERRHIALLARHPRFEAVGWLPATPFELGPPSTPLLQAALFAHRSPCSRRSPCPGVAPCSTRNAQLLPPPAQGSPCSRRGSRYKPGPPTGAEPCPSRSSCRCRPCWPGRRRGGCH